MKIISIILMLFGLFLLTGCSASETTLEPSPVTDAKDLVGTWFRREGYIQYNEDGTCRFAYTLDSLTEAPQAAGEFWFEGEQYFEKEIEIKDLSICGSTIGVYDVQRLENGGLEFVVLEDACRARALVTVGEYIPVD